MINKLICVRFKVNEINKEHGRHSKYLFQQMWFKYGIGYTILYVVNIECVPFCVVWLQV